MNKAVSEINAVIEQERNKTIGLLVWIDDWDHCGDDALKAKVVGVQIRTFDDEPCLVYITEGDFSVYIPWSPKEFCGSYQKDGSEKRHQISFWSEICSEDERKKRQEDDRRKLETLSQEKT